MCPFLKYAENEYLRTPLCDVYIIKVDGATNHNWISEGIGGEAPLGLF